MKLTEAKLKNLILEALNDEEWDKIQTYIDRGWWEDAMHFAEMLGSSEEFWWKFGGFDYINNLKNDSLIGLGEYLINNIVDKTNKDPEAESYRTGISEYIEMMKISNRRFMAREGLKAQIFGALHKYTERGVG